MDKYNQILMSFGAETTFIYYVVRCYEVLLSSDYDKAENFIKLLDKMMDNYNLDIYCSTLLAKIKSFYYKLTEKEIL